MTTILADYKLGVMVADSNIDDGDRQWSVRKVIRSRGALVGCAGTVSEYNYFLDWWKSGADVTPVFSMSDSSALVLDGSGLYIFDHSTIELTKVVGGREAIGTGSVAAISAYEALNWTNPRRAVSIACKHDSKSRAPVRVYKL